MYQSKGRNHAAVLQILVVRADLVRKQHAFIDNRASRHRRHVEFFAVGQIERLNRMAGAFANDVELALERVGDRNAATAADKDLANDRLYLFDRLSKAAVIPRDIAPTEQNLPFFLDRALDFVLTGKP